MTTEHLMTTKRKVRCHVCCGLDTRENMVEAAVGIGLEKLVRGHLACFEVSDSALWEIVPKSDQPNRELIDIPTPERTSLRFPDTFMEDWDQFFLSAAPHGRSPGEVDAWLRAHQGQRVRDPGRPNKTPGVGRVLKTLRLEPDVVAALERASDARGMSTGEMANRILKMILIELVQDDDHPTNKRLKNALTNQPGVSP